MDNGFTTTEPQKLQHGTHEKFRDLEYTRADNTKDDIWHHVSTTFNPADIISRGLQPNELLHNHLWWHGPSLLQEVPSQWPSTFPEVQIAQQVDLETKSTMNVLACTGRLSARELYQALRVLVKIAQKEQFLEEWKDLKIKGQVHRKSKLITLNPFIDTEDLIRVGGRMSHANLPYSQKHQLLLPAKHKLTELIIHNEHISLLHAGPQAVLSSLRLHFWPLSGRREVRKVTHKCITCFRHKPTSTNPIMGQLPTPTVTPSRPFHAVGLDYAGPISIKESHRRGRVHTFQCYVALYSSVLWQEEGNLHMSTQTMSTATNFVKANKDLRSMIEHLQNHTDWNQIEDFAAKEPITWHYIPPRSPTFGGLWEAAVKSVKSHMKKITGTANLTYEEYVTLLTQTEACLNSRPLIPASNDLNDLTVLTPSHFLLGQPLNLTPDPNYKDHPVHLLRVTSMAAVVSRLLEPTSRAKQMVPTTNHSSHQDR
ncbi:uncharacterized protein LOC115888919 [Sitophilus oryzae]|uniref:Uncharacterized protein LOC115888919 n=1 Tax=Sitophilus oryzae TaxID=7048 RepID=A0A6J2YN21_SITOR|nr:uncharacterized protein LOC115888919 [Sitophilus oryzae]